ncbi:MAG: DNA-directed RNA polymerase subunit omega [Wolbachia sp.]
MGEFIVERCIEQVGNCFKLVLLASQRTHDLNTGASNLVQTARFKDHKNTIISLYEISENRIDAHELFDSLVNRCKEYMKKNINKAHSSDVNQLANLLNFSDNADHLDINQKRQDSDKKMFT